jgi:hypothetical protein
MSFSHQLCEGKNTHKAQKSCSLEEHQGSKGDKIIKLTNLKGLSTNDRKSEKTYKTRV